MNIYAMPTESVTPRGNCFAIDFSYPFLIQDGGATGGASVPVACLAAGGGMNMGKYVWN